MTAVRVDQALNDLASSKQKWAQLPLRSKLAYLDQVRALIFAEARAWVEAACVAKGIAVDSPLAGEEWMSGPYAVLTWINAVQETLTDIAAGRDPLEKFPVRQRTDGQTVVTVYPHGLQERLLLNGVSAEVWMQPGMTPASLRDEIATFYKRPSHDGRLALVLGAGNIASIPALDVLYKLYVDGEVVILKLNPVNAYLGPIFERALAPLVADGFLRFAYGAGDVGEYLTRHEAVETIHITGSEHTHDMIIYGPGAEGTVRKARDERLLAKPITSELGGVGPTIVVPGPWKRRTSGSRPSTSPPRSCTTTGSTASPRRCSCCPRSGPARRSSPTPSARPCPPLQPVPATTRDRTTGGPPPSRTIPQPKPWAAREPSSST
jgi:aldehyde dehydrogenase (NAD(P)+)